MPPALQAATATYTVACCKLLCACAAAFEDGDRAGPIRHDLYMLVRAKPSLGRNPVQRYDSFNTVCVRWQAGSGARFCKIFSVAGHMSCSQAHTLQMQSECGDADGRKTFSWHVVAEA